MLSIEIGGLASNYLYRSQRVMDWNFDETSPWYHRLLSHTHTHCGQPFELYRFTTGPFDEIIEADVSVLEPNVLMVLSIIMPFTEPTMSMSLTRFMVCI